MVNALPIHITADVSFLWQRDNKAKPNNLSSYIVEIEHHTGSNFGLMDFISIMF